MQYIPNQYLQQWDNDLIFNTRIQNHPDIYQARRYRRSLQQIMKNEKAIKTYCKSQSNQIHF